MDSTETARNLILELEDRAKRDSAYLAEPKEDCARCHAGQSHITHIRFYTIFVFLSVLASVYIVAAGLPIPAVALTPIPMYPLATMVYMYLEKRAATRVHSQLASARDTRRHIACLLESLYDKRELQMQACLRSAQGTVCLFLKEIAEAKEDLRGQHGKLAHCLSGIIKIRDLHECLEIWALTYQTEKQLFSNQINNLRKALCSDSLSQARFTNWITALYREIKKLERALELVQGMDLDTPAGQSMLECNPDNLELALEGFLDALKSEPN